MARFCGEIGYGDAVESPANSGVYKDQITEETYYGDVVRNSMQLKAGESLNDDISVNNSISIVADEFAIKHFHKIKYVRWAGVTWAVDSVTVQAPRLILNLGGVYNGPTA